MKEAQLAADAARADDNCAKVAKQQEKKLRDAAEIEQTGTQLMLDEDKITVKVKMDLLNLQLNFHRSAELALSLPQLVPCKTNMKKQETNSLGLPELTTNIPSDSQLCGARGEAKALGVSRLFQEPAMNELLFVFVPWRLFDATDVPWYVCPPSFNSLRIERASFSITRKAMRLYLTGAHGFDPYIRKKHDGPSLRHTLLINILNVHLHLLSPSSCHLPLP
ncbi:hypothetical protein BKA70DRAFT_1431045 [Coprinopsis sp. MPI-PUGE-AT-0042]|nr:hypothetical protein BKA70DRAFT_1431045 [Coprinopsis sp. MPI-PUGE-AT-0042]